jgi:hypothetical protein
MGGGVEKKEAEAEERVGGDSLGRWKRDWDGRVVLGGLGGWYLVAAGRISRRVGGD